MCPGRPIFSVFIKENWIWAMARHHAESNINIFLTRNTLIDSGVRQWSHLLIIKLHCLWAKSNNRTRGQFEYDVTWFCFCFNFVCSHTWWSYCSIVCWRGREHSPKNGRPRSMGWKIFGCRWAGGGMSWKLDNFCSPWIHLKTYGFLIITTLLMIR